MAGRHAMDAARWLLDSADPYHIFKLILIIFSKTMKCFQHLKQNRSEILRFVVGVP